MSKLILLLLISLLSITSNDAARILAYFPAPSISHQLVFRPLTQELARRGHEVTVITSDPAFPDGESPANLTEIDVHDMSYEKLKTLHGATSTGDRDTLSLLRLLSGIVVELVETHFKVDKVQKVLKEEKFDLLLLEACVRPALILSHVVKAPIIQVSSLGPMNFNVEMMGSAWHPLLYPININQRLYNLTNWEKLVELWNFYKTESIFSELDAEKEMCKSLFGPNAPNINELKNNVDMLFLNVHPIWEGNRPVPPSVIYMGGLHQKPAQQLPADLQIYLDTSEKGIIYISFGTNVQPSLLPSDRVQLMAKVFSELPYDVLWKWDKDELPGRSKNIRISKWLPQSDLLRHPKIKVFITQGGLQSTDEAITAGVPLIGIPMLVDQWYNVEKYVHFKIGVKLDLLTLTEDEFGNAIKTVIGDQRFRHNIVKLSIMMRDQPMTPLERAVWWTEYVLRHGGARHLRGPAANMPWAQYLELELVLTLLATALGLIVLSSFIVYSLWNYFSFSVEQKKND